mgnify:FL=1
MNNTLHIYFKEFQFFSVRDLSIKEKHLLFNKLTKEKANIYFFIKKNVYFDRIDILDKYKITGDFINNIEKKYKFNFDMYKYYEKLLYPIAEKTGLSIEHILNQRMADLYYPNSMVTQKELENKYKEIAFIKEKNLSFASLYDPLYKSELELDTYKLINYFKYHINKDFVKSDIIYIGKSTDKKGIISRIINHEKWLPILSPRNEFDGDEICVFMFEIAFKNNLNIPKDIYIEACEQILINYFKPKENDLHKNSTLETEKISKLKKFGFDNYLIELNFEDLICNFGTKEIPHSLKHFITNNF